MAALGSFSLSSLDLLQPTAAVGCDTSLDTPDALHSISIVPVKVASKGTDDAFAGTWVDRGSGLRIDVAAEVSAERCLCAIEITNGLKYRIDQVDLQLPQIVTPSSPAIEGYTTFRGGAPAPWSPGDWSTGQGNTSIWPGTAFSPLATFWRPETGETLAITFFNARLVPSMVYWFSGAASPGQQQLNPFLRVLPQLQPGESASFSCEMQLLAGGPPAHWADYRIRSLMPFMTSLGVAEAAGPMVGEVGSSGWVSAGQLAATIQTFLALGIKDYIQWSPPDGASTYYNPEVPQLPWYSELAAASKLSGLNTLGVLINPFISPPLAFDDAIQGGGKTLANLRLDFEASDNRLYYARMCAVLAARGIKTAFWDTGGGPGNVNPHAWLKMLQRWKAAGISVLAETSCDLNAYVAGVWMEYPYSWGMYDAAKAICPKASLMAMTNDVDDRGGVHWYVDAEAKGVLPIVSYEQALDLRK